MVNEYKTVALTIDKFIDTKPLEYTWYSVILINTMLYVTSMKFKTRTLIQVNVLLYIVKAEWAPGLAYVCLSAIGWTLQALRKITLENTIIYYVSTEWWFGHTVPIIPWCTKDQNGVYFELIGQLHNSYID